jgi:hypothetical protein
MNIPIFTISHFAKLHDISEETVKKSLEFCILYTSEKGDEDNFLTENGCYYLFLSYSLFQLVASAREDWHLIQKGYLTGTNKLLVSTLATRFGWDGKSLD